MLDIFASDARRYVDRLREALAEDGGPNVDGVRRASRRLHHAAVLASHEPVIQASTALQKTTVQVIAGKMSWTPELNQAVEDTLTALDSVVSALPDGDARAEAQLRRAADALAGTASGSARRTDAAVESEAVGGAEDEAEAVLTALIGDLGAAVERLENDPRDREPLKAMLRKVRRLRDLERIEVMSPEDKALGAVEELILQIADLNATVGPGYLTVFRHARDVLEDLRERGAGAPSVTMIGGRASEVDRLKDSVMEKVRRARMVVWVSDLFYADGPHIVSCKVAEEQAGSLERYFQREATQRLVRSEDLRNTMLKSDTEQMRLAGESLAHTLRHLRERAAAFNHPEMGRLTRRAAAALRAQLVRPPKRLTALANGFGPVFKALRTYLETEDAKTRSRAIADADTALHMAILGGEPLVPAGAPEFDPDAALQQALALRTRVDEALQRISGPEADRLKEDLEELFDLIAQYVSASAESH